MKLMGTMKHDQITETLIGVLRFEILPTKRVDGTRFVTMRYKE